MLLKRGFDVPNTINYIRQKELITTIRIYEKNKTYLDTYKRYYTQQHSESNVLQGHNQLYAPRAPFKYREL